MLWWSKRRDRRGRLAAGGWRLAAGGWRLAAGGWRLAADLISWAGRVCAIFIPRSVVRNRVSCVTADRTPEFSLSVSWCRLFVPHSNKANVRRLRS
jgi:hypothetical protein